MAWYYITNIEYHPEETRIEEMIFCPSCMSKAAPVDGKCPVCGHDVNIQNAQYQLPVNCILNGRYVVGKVLGAATANLHLDAGVLPPFGVYAVRAGDEAGTERFPGIVNIGIAPTIRHEEHPAPKVEVHIFGRSLDLYGKRLAVELAANVRREKKFASLDELRAQIQTDIAAADKLLKGS